MPEFNAKQAFAAATQHHQAGRIAEAEALYRQVIAKQPRHGDALHLLGLLLIHRGDAAAAIEPLSRAVATNPQNGDFRYDLGVALGAIGRNDEAAAEYRKTIVLRPELPGAYSNLGSILVAQAKPEEAQELLEKARGKFPANALIRNNLGNAYRDLGRIDDAIAMYRQASALAPSEALLRWNLAIALLLKGNFAEGWPGYMYRHEAEKAPTVINLNQPMWDGSSLAGRGILLYTNQGLGDIIQCARFFPSLAAQGARVIVGLTGAQAVLRPLLRGQCGITQVVADDEPLPPIHVQCLLDRLPAMYGVTPQQLPGPIPYLRADATRAAQWQQRLVGETRLKIGLAWAGNRGHAKDIYRSIAPQLLSPLAQAPNIRWISLQKSRADSAPPELNLTDWTADLHDLADTAALIANLDLILTVDTSIAHLAGAIGKPVWTMIQYSPDWRWMLNRPDTPWYPTMRLFRQPRLRAWEPVIEHVLHELRARH
ncbi:MAG TPA: tetratricopeptide repeat protein [Humisphaera sp.]|jgi:Flp pilus assembly protein TadD|nr:tetratricopeptide repeat protein [Humisphaera sp.]